MANVTLPKQIKSISGAISKRRNHDGSVTVTYFQTRNGKTRLYTNTFYAPKTTEELRKRRKIFALATKFASQILAMGEESKKWKIWRAQYTHYLTTVSPVDFEKNRFKTFRGFLISRLYHFMMKHPNLFNL